MTKSGYFKDDPTFGSIDLDDEYITDSWLVDQFVGNIMLSCGYNTTGIIGDGTVAHKSSPVQVGSLTTWKQVATGIGHALAVKTDGTLWAWGQNNAGQLGQANLTLRSSPIQVGLLTTWKAVTTVPGLIAGNSSFGLRTDGSAFGWGGNGNGQLSTNDVASRSSPVQIGSLGDWKQISGGAHFLGIKTNGTLWSCGYNQRGALGLGDIINRSSLVQIGLMTNWKQVAVGSYHSMAIKTDGTLWAWGWNGLPYGQLGLGNATHYSSPVQVGSLTNWKQVSCGLYQTGMVKTDGTLWACGYGLNGQNGQGDAINRSSPVQIGLLTSWKSVASGGYHYSAVKTDGTLWKVGYNAYGQLGLGDIISRSSLVQIGLMTNWKQSFSGLYTDIAIPFADIT